MCQSCTGELLYYKWPGFYHTSLIILHGRGRNNTRSSDMTEYIYHLIGHKFFQFQALFGHFVKKKIFSSFLGFQVIYQQSRNNEPKRCLFTT